MYYTFISQGSALWFFFFCTVVYFSMHFWPPCDKDHFEFIFFAHSDVFYFWLLMFYHYLCVRTYWLIFTCSISKGTSIFIWSCCPIEAFSVEWSRALVVEFSSTIQIYHNSFILSFFMKKFPYRTNFSFESKEGISDRRW